METFVTLVNPVPVMTAVAPALAREGLTEVIEGRAGADAVAGPAARSDPPVKTATVMATGHLDLGCSSRMTVPLFFFAPRSSLGE
jgi:hypothetical protein